MKKDRILNILTNPPYNIGKKEAYSLILCGKVKKADETIKDPARTLPINTKLTIAQSAWVSRGAYKLLGAIEAFKLNPQNLVFVDAGASTGGFTQVLLEKGASYVYAVDVGYNQLDYSLRINPRVGVFEKTNILDFKPNKEEADIAVADLSFRSIEGALDHLLKIVNHHRVIALIKPQFELKNPDKDFDGVLNDENLTREILEDFYAYIKERNYHIANASPAAITGRYGNQEFFVDIYLDKPEKSLDKDEFLNRLFKR